MLEDGDIPFESQPEAINTLGTMCSQLGTIPDCMHIQNCQVISEREEFSGGFANVYRGVYRDRTVAVKNLRVYVTSDLEECFGVRSEDLQINSETSVLTTRSLEISQRSHRLEAPSTPAHFTTYRRDTGASPTCDGIRMDG